MNLISPWVKCLFELLVTVAVLAVLYFYGQQQFGLGEKAERALWLARENTGLVQANAKIKTLEEQYRTQEHKHAAAMAAISVQYQEDLKHVKATKDGIIAGLRGGTFRLRIPVASPVPTYGGAASGVGASTGGCDGGTRAELSVEASEFLVGLTSEADEVVKQLGKCQAVIKADRNTGEKNVAQ